MAWGSRGYPGCDSDGVGVLNESLQRIKPLTHLALLVHAAHAEPSQRDGDKDVGSSLPVSSPKTLSLPCVSLGRPPTIGRLQGSQCSSRPRGFVQLPFSPLHKGPT